MSYFSFDTVQQNKKCAVIGCGNQGGVAAHALAQSGIPDCLVLIDPDQRLARGQAADICGALPPDSDMDIWAGDATDLAGCSLIVLAAGISPVDESAHADLIALNTPILRKIASDIAANCPDAFVIVLSQPVDIMTYTVLRYSGLPRSRVVGVGTLPYTLRLQRLISKYIGADPKQINAMVLGEATEHATACWSNATACAMTLDAYLTDRGRSNDALILHSLLDDAVSACNHAVDAKGNAEFSNAAAALRIADAFFHNRNTLLTVCTLADGYCDLPRICMSLPCIISSRGAEIATGILPVQAEIRQLHKSAARLLAQLPDADISDLSSDNVKRVL